MSTKPIATIIVPARDIAGYLPAALESLQSQTVSQWRAIIINDESRDDTGRIADTYASSDSRFSVLHLRENVGLGAARNLGLEYVDTKYLGFLDGDDEFAPEAIESWCSTLERTGSPFASSAYVRLREQADGSYSSGRVQPWVSAATDPSIDGCTLAERPTACGNIVVWSKMYSTNFWQDGAFAFPGGAYEDQLISQRLYVQAPCFDTIAKPLVRWRLRPGSITASKDQLQVLLDYLFALRAGLEVLLSDHQYQAVCYRIRLIRSIDLPPLEVIAQGHALDDYRQALLGFQDWLSDLPGADENPRDPAITAGLAW